MIANSDTRPTLVIVGNGMVSHALCDKLRQLDATKHYRVIVIGDECRPAYDRVNLSKVFSGHSAADLELAGTDWYQDNRIELRLEQRVVSIDPETKQLQTDAGENVSYDKLVLVTGSIPFRPPIPGNDLDGVFVYRTIEDLAAIESYSRSGSSAAVLGGGLLGLEAAKALLDLKLDTHVIEMAPVLMPRQLDTEAAQFLQRKVEALGIDVHLLKQTQSISDSNGKRMLQFANDTRLTVDMVVISAGIRPRNDLAIQAGLQLGDRQGIAVNDRLETSHKDIYAIGECAEHNGVIYGLYAPGYQMADVLAVNLSGGHASFTQGDQSAKLKLLGVDVATIGSPLSEIANARTYCCTTANAYRKLIISEGKPVALISVGPWPEMNRVQQAITAGTKVWPWHRYRFQRSGNLWPASQDTSVNDWPADATVCSCKNVCRGTLTAACQAGCTTVSQLAEQTGASSVCGSCKPLLSQMVDSPDEAETTPAHSGLLVACLVAIAILSLWLWPGAVQVSRSVSDAWHQVDLLLTGSLWKQVTGYSLVGIAVIGMLLPLRKRVAWFSFGAYGFWRTLHATVGTLTLVGLIIHTGLRLGANLNFLLALIFLGVNLTGAAVGVFASMESRLKGRSSMTLRRWRPRVTRMHVWLLWPLPALLAIHIFCVYYY